MGSVRGRKPRVVETRKAGCVEFGGVECRMGNVDAVALGWAMIVMVAMGGKLCPAVYFAKALQGKPCKRA